MKKVVDLKMVKGVIKDLEQQGEPVNPRKILAITGGSMTTVLTLMREAQQQLAAAALVPNKNLPENIADAIQGHVTLQVVSAIAQVQAELAAARTREDETLMALGEAEEQMEGLQQELQLCRQENANLRLQAEKSAATGAQLAEDLSRQLEDLRAEQRRLAEAGEAARTGLAMADLERRKATEAAEKSEAKAFELQTKYEALLGQHANFEKRLAAEKTAAELRAAQAEQKVLECNSQLQWLEKAMTLQVVEAKEDGSKEKVVLRDRLRVADEALARAEERAARMETELRDLRKPAQLETDKAVND